MVDVKEDFLKLAKKIELSVGELYSFFALKIPEDKEIWEKMSLEEKAHANIIDKFAKEYKQQPLRKVPDKSILIRMMNSINDITDYIQKHRNEKITRKEALEKAVQCEQMALETHFHDFFSSLKPEGSADILKLLQDEDKKHLNHLKRYLKK